MKLYLLRSFRTSVQVALAQSSGYCFWLGTSKLIRRWKYPCGVCSAPVKYNQRGVQCDVCTSWLHAKCIGVSNEEYATLQQSDDLWCCKRCAKESLPFFNVSSSDSVFNTSANDHPDSIFNTSNASGGDDASHQSLHTACTSHQFSALYTNCRSLSPKLDHLRLLAAALIICL